MRVSQSIDVKREIFDVMGHIRQCSLSTNDDYLQIWFEYHEDKHKYVQIIDLLTRDVIFTMAFDKKLPLLKFTKDSKYLYLGYYERLTFISLRNHKIRKSLFTFKSMYPIYHIFELKYGTFLFADKKYLKICKKSKMIRKITSVQQGFDEYADIRGIDYNPTEDLILLQHTYKLCIVSLVHLRIFTYENPRLINQQAEDFSKMFQQASFFKNGIITLEQSGVKFLEFNQQNQQFIQKKNCSSFLNYNIESYQAILQENFLALLFSTKLIILNQNFQIIRQIINYRNFNLLKRNRSKNKICICISVDQIEIQTLYEI